MYTVIKDNQEKLQGNGWFFQPMEVKHLKTGDYTLVGYEDVLTIERKASTGEIAKNITEKRFERELERMKNFRWPFMIFEFDLIDVKYFPENSGIPREIWPKLRITSNFMLKKLAEYQVYYPVKIIFASKFGKETAETIFKEVVRACK